MGLRAAEQGSHQSHAPYGNDALHDALAPSKLHHRYNKRAEDFETKLEFDDFLEEREDIGTSITSLPFLLCYLDDSRA